MLMLFPTFAPVYFRAIMGANLYGFYTPTSDTIYWELIFGIRDTVWVMAKPHMIMNQNEQNSATHIHTTQRHLTDTFTHTHTTKLKKLRRLELRAHTTECYSV